MNKKLLMLFLVGIMFLNGCDSQVSKNDDKTKKDNVVADVQVEEKEDKESKKQDSTSSKENKQEKSVEESKEEKTTTSTQVETPKVSNKNSSSNKKEPQSSNTDKPTTPSKPKQELPKQEQPQQPVEEKKPEQPKEEIAQPIKQDAMARDVMNKINNYRIQNGLQPLESTQYYQDKADNHAYAMAERRALWHGDSGECITNHPDPFTAWINSPEHNDIILTENNTKGVVSIYYVDGYYYSVFRTAW
ncbi:CAP domain-containing protein [[Clostridium] innocuum]|nr:CAP domain-containing protein [[Clostridium] innocuum]